MWNLQYQLPLILDSILSVTPSIRETSNKSLPAFSQLKPEKPFGQKHTLSYTPVTIHLPPLKHRLNLHPSAAVIRENIQNNYIASILATDVCKHFCNLTSLVDLNYQKHGFGLGVERKTCFRNKIWKKIIRSVLTVT